MDEEQNKVINQTTPAVKIRLKPIAAMIFCKCGCGQKRPSHDKQGRPRFFIYGHVNRGRKMGDLREYLHGEEHPMWKGGRRRADGYIMVQARHHPKADRHGYIFEHILVYEQYHKCCILPWICVHHKNGKRDDNRPGNLKLVTREEHASIHRAEICRSSNLTRYNRVINRGAICPRCGSNYVIKNATQGICKKCGKYFRAPWAPEIPIIERYCACIECHNNFQTKNSQRRYCSKSCNDKQYRLEHEEKIKQYELERRKQKALRIQPERFCVQVWCSNRLQVKRSTSRYCSKSCSDKQYRLKQYREEYKQYVKVRHQKQKVWG